MHSECQTRGKASVRMLSWYNVPQNSSHTDGSKTSSMSVNFHSHWLYHITAVKLAGAAIRELCDGAVISKLNIGAPGLLLICSVDCMKLSEYDPVYRTLHFSNASLMHCVLDSVCYTTLHHP